MKALRYSGFLLDIIKSRMLSQKKPLVVCLNVTNRCNLKCSYCYGDYSNRSAKDFTAAQLSALIEELSLMGTRLIHLSGGEPLVRDDIGEIIAKIKAKNMLCFMNTNGQLVPERIKSLRGLDGLTISLDGDEHAHDANRGAGSFKKAMMALKSAREAGIPVSTNTVINRSNLNSLDAVISLARQLGFTAEFNLPYEQALGDKDNSVLSLEDGEIREVLKKLIALARKGAPLSFSASSRKYALSWPLPYSQKVMYEAVPGNFKIIKCFMGRFMCLIDSDGLVFPCGQLLGKFPALNIHAVGFKNAWKNLSEKMTCKSCYCMCFTEFNQLFGIRPAMLLSTARRVFRNLKEKK